MMSKRRNYTREFKIEAVRLLESNGKKQTEIADDLGVPDSNLTRWKQECGE
jgi:transposase